ncbi:MAG: Uma2 family endonuclease [Chthoniobacter sp.]
MLSVLDEPAFRGRVSRLSLKEYHQLGEYNENGKRTELIRGFVIEKMSKSPLHGTIASVLQELLIPRVASGFFVRREEPLTLRDSEPEPDITVVRGQRGDYLEVHPGTAALVVEVAVSSPDADRILAEIYAEAGVEEYWIALPQERLVEVYRHPEGSRYREMRTYSRGEEIASEAVPGLRLALAELYAALR